MSGDVFVKIDRIVLHGMEHLDARDLAAALHSALTEQLTAGRTGLAVDLARVKTQIDLPRGFTAEQVGQALAGSLHGVIAGNDAEPLAGRHRTPEGRGDA